VKHLIAAAAIAALAGAAPALAQTHAITTTAVNLRSGPDLNYPPVVVLPPNTAVVVYGCMNAWSWCDVSWGPQRGWIAGAYLTAMWENQRRPWQYAAPRYNVPIVTFNFGNYWDNHYRGRNWYRQRDRWNRWDHDRRRWR